MHFVEGGTIQKAVRGDEILIRENPQVSLMGQIFGGLGGIAFITGAWAFWEMPVDASEADVLWIRVILCGGLGAIGAMLGWSALWPKKSITQIEMDRAKRELRVGKVKPEADFISRHDLPFKDIKRFYAGSQSLGRSAEGGGATVLYVEAEGGPRNGVLLVGATHELEKLASDLNEMLDAPLIVARSSSQNDDSHKRGGFGKRGL